MTPEQTTKVNVIDQKAWEEYIASKKALGPSDDPNAPKFFRILNTYLGR